MGQIALHLQFDVAVLENGRRLPLDEVRRRLAKLTQRMQLELLHQGRLA